MHMGQLRPASALALQLGVKSVGYGPPGSGKTPLINTAPRPVLMACEPGMLSMRTSNVPAWEGYNVAAIADFFAWLWGSAETRNFDTVGIDSISQMAEIILTDELKKNKDGRKAYGEMSRKMMEYLNGLYFMPNKHTYLVCKMQVTDENGVSKRRPYFPGQDLNVKVPHLFDAVLYVARTVVPGQAGEVPAIRAHEDYNAMARDRSGKLAALEPMDLSRLFAKAMS